MPSWTGSGGVRCCSPAPPAWPSPSALAVAAAAQWLANWVITTTFPGISGFSLGLAYGIYTLFSILAFVFVIRAVPETKGRELEDMDRLAAPRARV
ncbi:MFS transporter [Spirillospora sp. CA-128828]|uniref:MFS transporter n=1 Tax=Spirillospora sp. CA-128828 TaxID=3240033 RepID=UPI003D8C04AB